MAWAESECTRDPYRETPGKFGTHQTKQICAGVAELASHETNVMISSECCMVKQFVHQRKRGSAWEQ